MVVLISHIQPKDSLVMIAKVIVSVLKHIVHIYMGNMLVNIWPSWKKNQKMPSNVSSHNSARTVEHLTILRRCIQKHMLLSVLILLLKLKKQRRLPKRDGPKQRCPRPKETTVFVRRRSAIYVLLQEKNNSSFLYSSLQQNICFIYHVFFC